MPKVGKLKIQVDGTDFSFTLYYDDSHGFFAKEFPDHIKRYMLNHYGNSERRPVNQANTKQELEDQLKEVLKEYMVLTATKKKVIRLRVGMSTQLYLKQKDNEFGGKSWDGTNVHDHFQGLQVHEYNTSFSIHTKIPLAFGLDYEIGFLLEAAHSRKFHRIMNSGNMSPHGDPVESKDIIIDYTEEKHQFLDSLVDALRKLAANLFTVMTDEKKMMQLIENNVKMLTNAI
jgi:hypothetical protein